MTINWFGALGQGQGYSGSGENICIALEKLGVDVRLVGFKQANETNLTPEGLKIKKKPFIYSPIAICYGFPVSFSSIYSWQHKIGFTMFETDKLPAGKSWAGITGNPADSCNALSRLFVPCQHNKKLFSDSGVRIPIDVVPLGININLFPFLRRPIKRNIFTFLQLGTLSVRKNPGAVISAFSALFKGRKDVQLILKTQGGHFGNFKFFEAPNIKVIDRYSTPEEILSYYEIADCFVFPSRGEGFGLPPLEAMSTGLPVIMANNTGMADYAREDICYPLALEGQKPAFLFPKNWGDVGNWYESSYEDLKAKMWHVFTHQAEARLKGEAAAEFVRANYTFDHTAKRIVDILNKL